MVTDPFLLGCIGSDDCNIYLSAFKLSTVSHINFFLPQAPKGSSKLVNYQTFFVWNCVII